MKHKNKGKLEKYKAFYSEENYDNEDIVISFKYTCEKNFLLKDWNKPDDLKDLNSCLKTISQINWIQFLTHKGLNAKVIRGENFTKELPSNISNDETIFEVRVSNSSSKRLFGYRNKNIFYIIWFDLKHEALPYHKVKR